MMVSSYRIRLLCVATALVFAFDSGSAAAEPAADAARLTVASTSELAQQSRLVQIGFTYPLNWQFVTSQAQVVQQIFALLPSGVAYAIGANPDQVAVAQLQPLDTTFTLGYVTTLALVYIPAGAVETLQQQIFDPNSPLYSHPDSQVSNLMFYINPGIWIAP